MAIYFINFSLRRTIRRNISMKANKLYLLKSLNMDAIWMSLVAVKRVWVQDIKNKKKFGDLLCSNIFYSSQ